MGLGKIILYSKHDERIEKVLQLIDDCRRRRSKRHPKHEKIKVKKAVLEKSNNRIVEVANNLLFNEH